MFLIFRLHLFPTCATSWDSGHWCAIKKLLTHPPGTAKTFYIILYIVPSCLTVPFITILTKQPNQHYIQHVQTISTVLSQQADCYNNNSCLELCTLISCTVSRHIHLTVLISVLTSSTDVTFASARSDCQSLPYSRHILKQLVSTWSHWSFERIDTCYFGYRKGNRQYSNDLLSVSRKLA